MKVLKTVHGTRIVLLKPRGMHRHLMRTKDSDGMSMRWRLAKIEPAGPELNEQMHEWVDMG